MAIIESGLLKSTESAGNFRTGGAQRVKLGKGELQLNFSL